MPMSKVLRLGTRRSLLAWAQSSWVAREIERLNPGVRVELVGIDTRGDKIQDVSLQKVEGKDFFVAELDDNLRAGTVDLSVHSMKDLSLDRPREFVCAAIPKRENPRDVALFGPGVIERLRRGEKIRVGTSSPRRLENIPAFLELALPRLPADGDSPGSKIPELEFVEIRGNVNTRLARVLEDEASPRYLDAVILAFAGMIRLWADEKARIEAAQLLSRCRWMVLPIAENPTAPAQGALSIECREADSDTRAMIAKMHCAETASHVSRERDVLAEAGGGCHQRFGATSFTTPEAGDLFYLRGRLPDGRLLGELRWSPPGPRPTGAKPWDGSASGQGDATASKDVFRAAPPTPQAPALFVAHSRAWPAGSGPALGPALGLDRRIWCSGTKSWFKLAALGVWVEGCAENLGFDWLTPTLQEKVLQLPPLGDWQALTHEGALEGWEGKIGSTVATYRVDEPANSLNSAERLAFENSTHYFWSSSTQFDSLWKLVPRDAHHACGPGKTARHLRDAGLNPVVFPAVEEWKKWLGK